MATATATKKPTAFKLPKKLAECADLLYTTREERLKLQKEVDALQARETQLREHIINTLPKSAASGIAGVVARATIELKTVVQVDDFDKVVGYIAANFKKNPGVSALIQRRVNDKTVKEMWEAGKTVPGTKPLEIKVVSLNKL